jgi:hypothetical protein
VSCSARWAFSALDCQAHLLVSTGDLPWGVLTARCGHLLLAGGSPPARAAQRCSACAEIAARPFLVLAPWTARPQNTEDEPASSPAITRVMWAPCRIDEHVHLLSARAVVEFVGMGCAVASCGTLLIVQELTLRGWGTRSIMTENSTLTMSCENSGMIPVTCAPFGGSRGWRSDERH